MEQRARAGGRGEGGAATLQDLQLEYLDLSLASARLRRPLAPRGDTRHCSCSHWKGGLGGGVRHTDDVLDVALLASTRPTTPLLRRGAGAVREEAATCRRPCNHTCAARAPTRPPFQSRGPASGCLLTTHRTPLSPSPSQLPDPLAGRLHPALAILAQAAKAADGTIKYDLDTSIEATWNAMEGLVEKGLVKQIGVSNFNEEQIDRIMAASTSAKPSVLQVESHPWMQKQLIAHAEAAASTSPPSRRSVLPTAERRRASHYQCSTPTLPLLPRATARAPHRF